MMFSVLQSSIVEVSACLQLERLNLSNNNLTNVSAVVSIVSGLVNLYQLNLKNNFKEDVSHHLPPNIKIFNGKVIGELKDDVSVCIC